MNCRRAARLLCLDVGGDLGPRRSSTVAGHVAICPACRTFRDELSAVLENARSLEVPSWEHDGEQLRRRVWSEIRRDRHRTDTRKAQRLRLLVAAAGCSAAVLLTLHFLARRPAGDSTPVAPHANGSAVASAPIPAAPAPPSPRTAPVVELPTALASRPRGDAREGGITRIEFRTPDRSIRIIWLVGSGAPEASAPAASGPKQEVS